MRNAFGNYNRSIPFICNVLINFRSEPTVYWYNHHLIHVYRIISLHLSVFVNIASIKVAENVGMKKENEFITQYYNGDMLHYLYSIHK